MCCIVCNSAGLMMMYEKCFLFFFHLFTGKFIVVELWMSCMVKSKNIFSTRRLSIDDEMYALLHITGFSKKTNQNSFCQPWPRLQLRDGVLLSQMHASICDFYIANRLTHASLGFFQFELTHFGTGHNRFTIELHPCTRCVLCTRLPITFRWVQPILNCTSVVLKSITQWVPLPTFM